MKKKQVLKSFIMVVSPDEYELPYDIGTIDEIAEKLNIKKNTIYKSIDRLKKGEVTNNKHYKFVWVKLYE